MAIRRGPCPATADGDVRPPVAGRAFARAHRFRVARRPARQAGAPRSAASRPAARSRAVRIADIVDVVSPVDAGAFVASRPGARVEVVTNGVDTDRFDPAAVGPVEELRRHHRFIGAMSFRPNVEAAVWLVREVLPRLRARRPGVRVRLIGRDPVPAVTELAAADVDVTGTVDDVRPEIMRCPVIAIPMVSGSGVKNKVLEAMALARPIVSTTLGIESLDAVDGRDLVVADGAEGFAAALDRMLGDAAGRAASAARRGRSSWTAIRGRPCAAATGRCTRTSPRSPAPAARHESAH